MKISTMHDDSSKMWFLRSSNGRTKLMSVYSSLMQPEKCLIIRIRKLTVAYYGFMPLKKKLQFEWS